MRRAKEKGVKNVVKNWIRNCDKRRIYSKTVIFRVIDKMPDEAFNEHSPAPDTLCRRIRGALSELKASKEFKFIRVQKKSAEDWFKIVKV